MNLEHLQDRLKFLSTLKKYMQNIMNLKKLRLKPESSLMIGDWPERDVVGAKKIGMKTAFAVYGDTFGTKNSGADWDVEDISELVTIIKKNNNIE